MPIEKLKKHQSNKFVVVDTDTFNAISRVDGLAASIWVYLQAKPEDWIVRPTDVQQHFGIGRKSYFARLRVLRDFGVYWNTSDKSDDGKFRNGTIHVSSVPVMTSNLPSAPKGHPGDPKGHRGDPNRYTGKGDSRKRAPLQKKESLQKKDIQKGKGRKTRDVPLSEFLNDRSWANE